MKSSDQPYAAMARAWMETMLVSLKKLSKNDLDEINKITTRTTILAMRCDAEASLVVACDGLASSGWGQKYRTNSDKIDMLDEFSAIASCGFASPPQQATPMLRRIFGTHDCIEGRELSVDGKLHLVDLVTEWFCDVGLYFYPIFAAFDHKANRGRIFDLWGPGGGHDEKERYYANGSGGDTAFTILQNGYHLVRSTDDAVRLAIYAIHRAAHRVNSANEPQHIKIVRANGYERIFSGQIQKELDNIRKNDCPVCREEREGGVV